MTLVYLLNFVEHEYEKDNDRLYYALPRYSYAYNYMEFE